MISIPLVIFAAFAVAFAILLLVARQPMRGALCLIGHMLSLAGIYATLGVHVVAVFQVLIYVGAVMVFMVYTIMLLDDRDSSFRSLWSGPALPGGILALVVGGLFARLLLKPGAGLAAVQDGGSALFSFSVFSRSFMEHYWFHFEMATVLLLVGIVAAWSTLKEGRRAR